MGRDDGQVREAPLAALHFVAFGDGERYEVTDGRGKHEFRTFEVVLFLGKTAQGLGDIGRDRGFFRYDQRFAHEQTVGYYSRLPNCATSLFSE